MSDGPAPIPFRHPGGRTCQLALLQVMLFWPFYAWKTWRSERVGKH
jgi:hypothetical protein